MRRYIGYAPSSTCTVKQKTRLQRHSWAIFRPISQRPIAHQEKQRRAMQLATPALISARRNAATLPLRYERERWPSIIFIAGAATHAGHSAVPARAYAFCLHADIKARPRAHAWPASRAARASAAHAPPRAPKSLFHDGRYAARGSSATFISP